MLYVCNLLSLCSASIDYFMHQKREKYPGIYIDRALCIYSFLHINFRFNKFFSVLVFFHSSTDKVIRLRSLPLISEVHVIKTILL